MEGSADATVRIRGNGGRSTPIKRPCKQLIFKCRTKQKASKTRNPAKGRLKTED